jgi:hypothetical protein
LRSILFENLANARTVSAELVLVSVVVCVGAFHLQVFAVVSYGRCFNTVGEVAKRFSRILVQHGECHGGFEFAQTRDTGNPGQGERHGDTLISATRIEAAVPKCI